MGKLLDALKKLVEESATEEVEETDEADHETGVEDEGEQLEDIAADDTDEEGEDTDSDDIEDAADDLADGDEDGTDGTTPNEEAADAELRQTITDQAALIESLRNQIAALGGEVDEDEADDEEAGLDTDEADAIEAFDVDYAARKAALAEMTKGN